MPVLAQLINSSLLWKDKGVPYTNTHRVLWGRERLSSHLGWSIWGCHCSLCSLALWSCWLPCECAVAVQGMDQLEKWCSVCFAGLLLTGVASLCCYSRRDSAILQSVRAGSRTVTTYLPVELFELSFFTGMYILHWFLDFYVSGDRNKYFAYELPDGIDDLAYYQLLTSATYNITKLFQVTVGLGYWHPPPHPIFLFIDLCESYQIWSDPFSMMQ